MITPDNEFIDSGKHLLKRIPGFQKFNGIRHELIRINDLSTLIKQNKIVVFHPFAFVDNNAALIREMVNEVVKERIDLYGTVRLRKTKAARMGFPTGAILLYSPLALLRIPSTHEDYLKGVEKEIRRKIRVAQREGYVFKEFEWNDHLDEIFEINTSKEIRQSVPMRGWYREPVQPRNHSNEAMRYYKKNYGAFKDGKLYAYLHFYLFSDFAISRHFIGHAQHLRFGIMNGLLSYTVQEFIENFHIQWFYYGEWQRRSSLTSFKREAGFQAYAILLDLEGDQELVEYSEQMVRTIWRL